MHQTIDSKEAAQAELYEQPFVTKKLLLQIAEEGDWIGFNRQIEPTALPKVRDEDMPVDFLMYHEHIAGEPSFTHCRCWLGFRVYGDETRHHVFIDMKIERYRDLPFRLMPKTDSRRPSSRFVPRVVPTPGGSGVMVHDLGEVCDLSSAPSIATGRTSNEVGQIGPTSLLRPF